MTARMTLAMIAAAWTATGATAEPATIRVATFNVQDVRTEQIASGSDERLRGVADVIRAIDPDIILLNEVAYDGAVEGGNGQRFADLYLRDGAPGAAPAARYRAFSAPSNTGVPSGLDLDNNGKTGPGLTGRDYGGDSLGYGEFPGQYGMTLLVREGLVIDDAGVRTFRSLRWKDMPGALLPPRTPEDPASSWYTPEMLEALPLSSKSHWDVPVRMPDGAVVRVLCSHPTPPVFDGPEDRNGRRNHDEIRFWADYLAGEPYIVDDAGVRGGLAREGAGPAHFVILGDLNADPSKGDSRDNPVGRFLLNNPLVNGEFVPRSNAPFPRAAPEDTARFRLRVDYVLPSSSLRVTGGGVYRGVEDAPPARPGASSAPALKFDRFPSDHFPVWVDLIVPSAMSGGAAR